MDETSVDEIGVDEIGVDEPGINPHTQGPIFIKIRVSDTYTKRNKPIVVVLHEDITLLFQFNQKCTELMHLKYCNLRHA